MKKRMITWEKSLFDALWCAAMILFVCAANVVAQTGIVRQGPPACSAQDKVEVASFTLNPAAPAIGQAVTIKLKIRSKCPAGTADLRVPWEIKKTTANNSTTMSSGTETLAPGASKDVTTNWTAVAGTNNFHGSVTLTDGGNNNTSDDVTVTLSPPMVSQLLDYEKAKRAGANFSHNPEGATPCKIESVDVKEIRERRISVTTPDAGIAFTISCSNLPAGGRGTPEAFTNFRLKNGWKVKEFEVVGVNKNIGDWQWRQTPHAGSDNPYMKMRIWADALGWAIVTVKVVIEGPEGTNPYQ